MAATSQRTVQRPPQTPQIFTSRGEVSLHRATPAHEVYALPTVVQEGVGDRGVASPGLVWVCVSGGFYCAIQGAGVGSAGRADVGVSQEVRGELSFQVCTPICC